MKVSLILTCAGKGLRAGFSKNKVLVEVDGKSSVDRALQTFIGSGRINQFILTANQEDFSLLSEKYGETCTVVLGGATRTDSVKNALAHVDGDIVLIHDGARPFLTRKMIDDCIESASANGGCIPVIPSPNTVIRKSGEAVDEYLGKDELFSVQTPQGFKTELIKRAYACAGERAYNDDGEVYAKFIGKLATYLGDAKNVKLTFPEDFDGNECKTRFGTGFDCHKLVEGRKLILGGITIPHDKGLLGHSDADVLTHAIMDAILSATAMRDIGYHFSDKDAKYKDANSMALLNCVLEIIKKLGYRVESVSATVMAEKPKLLNFIPTITENLATALSLTLDKVGIAATTLEGLGFVGREEGICVNATAVVTKM